METEVKPTSPPPRSYAAASIPEPYRILGLRLRPFSLGHYLLFERFHCAFLCADPALATRQDLLLGVLICSMRHDEFLAFLEQKNFTQEITRWGKRIGLFDFPAKAALFRAYLDAGRSEPNYIPMQPGDEHGDWAQNLKMTLITRLGYTEPQALDMPLCQALADYFRLAESEGLVRIITPEDLAAAEANTKIFEQLANPPAERKDGDPCQA